MMPEPVSPELADKIHRICRDVLKRKWFAPRCVEPDTAHTYRPDCKCGCQLPQVQKR